MTLPQSIKTLPVSAVWLRREGDYAVVLVEIGGVWYKAISEHVEGNFSHMANVAGADHWEEDDRGL